jgi:hypothetical protein
MPKAKRFSTEQILAVQNMLLNLPSKKTGKTKKEMVECLAGSIRKALKKGHSLKEIQGILAGEGIRVSLARLVTLVKKEDAPVQKKEANTTPVQSDIVDCGLFTVPAKKERE